MLAHAHLRGLPHIFAGAHWLLPECCGIMPGDVTAPLLLFGILPTDCCSGRDDNNLTCLQLKGTSATSVADMLLAGLPMINGY